MALLLNDRITGPYTAVGGETAFAYDFRILAVADLAVWRLRGGVETRLTYGTHYTVSGVGSDGGGTVTLTTPATAGDKISLEGARPVERTSNLSDASGLGALLLNGEYDAHQVQLQELIRQVGRTLRAGPFAPAMTSLPTGEGVIVINAAGQPTLVPSSVIAATNVVTTDAMIATSYASVTGTTVAAGVPWIWTMGRATAGDGGGMLYANPTGTLPAHSAYLMVLVAGVARYYIAAGEYLDPLALGAVGDGVADDSTALQATITAAAALGIPVRMMREKTYKTTTSVIVPSGVVWENPAQAVIADSRRVGGYTIQVGATGAPANSVKLRGLNLRGDARGNYIASHIGIYANATVYSPSVVIHWTEDLEVTGCTIRGYGSSGIRTDYTINRMIAGNEIMYCGLHGVSGSSAMDDSVHENVIDTISPGAVGVGTPPASSGVSVWKSALWAVGTSYAANDGIFYSTVDGGGTHYRCTIAHDAAAEFEPGIGSNWTAVWVVVPARGYWIGYGITHSRDLSRLIAEAPISANFSSLANKVSRVYCQTGIDTHGGQGGVIKSNALSQCHLGIHTEAADYSGGGASYVAAVEMIIDGNNIIGDAIGPGISIDGASTGVNEYGTKVINNTIRGCGWKSGVGTFGSGFGGAIRASKVTSLLVAGNTLYYCTNAAVTLDAETRAIIAHNDIILPVSDGMDAIGIWLRTATSGATLLGNRFRLTASAQTGIDAPSSMTYPAALHIGAGNVLDTATGTLVSANALTAAAAALAMTVSPLVVQGALSASSSMSAPALYAASSAGAGFLVMQRNQQILSGDIGWWRGYSLDYSGTPALKEYVRMIQAITSNTLGAEAADVAIQLRDAGTLAEAIRFKGNGEVNIKGTRVLKARETGWTASTGTALKGAFATGTATLVNCAERIKALEDAMRNHGLIN